MLHIFFQTLPCFICLILAIFYSAIKEKSRLHVHFLQLLIVAGVFYFSNMGLELHSCTPKLGSILYVAGVFSSLTASSIMMVIISRETSILNHSLLHQAMFMISFFITVSLATLFACIFIEGQFVLISIPPDPSYLKANDGLLNITYYFSRYAYNYTLVGLAVLSIISAGLYIFRRRRIFAIAWKERMPLKETDARVLFIFAFLVMGTSSVLLGNAFMEAHPYYADVASFLTAFLLSAAAYCGLANVKKEQSHLGSLVLDKEQEVIFESNEKALENGLDIDAGINQSEVSEQQAALLERFRKFFETGRAYLDPNMTIERVTLEISSNRTYVSSLINKIYGMPFRSLVNKRRIEEAKVIMKENPDLILEDIAAKSGFTSASQLSRKFKEEEGITPREWLKAES